MDDNIQAVNAARVRLIQALDRANANDYQSALAAAQNYAQTFWMISNRFPWGDHKRETFLGFKTGKGLALRLHVLRRQRVRTARCRVRITDSCDAVLRVQCRR